MNRYSEEILRRIDTKKRKQEVRKLQLLSLTSAALVAALVIVISQFVTVPIGQVNNPVLGAFLLEPVAGSYVLVAVMAFLIGVCFTVLMIKLREMKTRKKKEGSE